MAPSWQGEELTIDRRSRPRNLQQFSIDSGTKPMAEWPFFQQRYSRNDSLRKSSTSVRERRSILWHFSINSCRNTSPDFHRRGNELECSTRSHQSAAFHLKSNPIEFRSMVGGFPREGERESLSGISSPDRP